jgi:hypothetical protein
VRDYSLVFPGHFAEDAALIEAKGWLVGVAIEVGEDHYRPEFYDPVRLAQTVADDLQRDSLVVLDDIIVVPNVTSIAIEAAVRRLADEDFASLRPLPD